MTKFTKSHFAANRGDTTYQSSEAGGVIKLPRSIGVAAKDEDGKDVVVHPEVLEITARDAAGNEVTFVARKEKKAPETKEQRTARLAELRAKNAQLTPEQKLAAKKQRAADALARAEAAIAKAQAKAAKPAAPATEGEAPAAEAVAQQ